MKPFLKWAGGKYKIIDTILANLPDGDQLIEPFVGSGAVFLNANFDEYLLSDLNLDLINLFNLIKFEGKDFIEYAQSYFTVDNNTEKRFYELREKFNYSSNVSEKSAIFIYLNRHCFNGLCRYNSKGGFNVPFGRYNAPTFPLAELNAFHVKSQKAIFKNTDFRQAMSEVLVTQSLNSNKKSIVYCDPPYVPLSATASFSDYTKDGFSLKDQTELANYATQLRAKNISVIISNHHTPITEALYNNVELITFNVQRFISSKTEKRVKAPELIALYV